MVEQGLRSRTGSGYEPRSQSRDGNPFPTPSHPHLRPRAPREPLLPLCALLSLPHCGTGTRASGTVRGETEFKTEEALAGELGWLERPPETPGLWI